jgi:hypothetical protein
VRGDRLAIRKRSPSTVNTKEAAHMHHASRAASRELIPPGTRFRLLLAAPGVMVAPLFVSPSLKTNGDTFWNPMHPRMIFRHYFRAESGPRRTRLSRRLGTPPLHRARPVLPLRNKLVSISAMTRSVSGIGKRYMSIVQPFLPNRFTDVVSISLVLGADSNEVFVRE